MTSCASARRMYAVVSTLCCERTLERTNLRPFSFLSARNHLRRKTLLLSGWIHTWCLFIVCKIRKKNISNKVKRTCRKSKTAPCTRNIMHHVNAHKAVAPLRVARGPRRRRRRRGPVGLNSVDMPIMHPITRAGALRHARIARSNARAPRLRPGHTPERGSEPLRATDSDTQAHATASPVWRSPLHMTPPPPPPLLPSEC